MMWVAFLKEKSETFDKFKIFKKRVENEFSVKIKYLRFDKGREFTSRDLNISLKRMESKGRYPHLENLSQMRLQKVEIN